MAVVSNTCNGSLGSDCKVYLEYKINNSEADRIQRNKSNITLHLYGQATANIPTYNNNGNCSANIKINGSTKASSSSLSMDFRNKRKVEMLTWTGDVSHGVDGKLTITISGSFDTNGPSGVTTGSVSKSWALPTIPRASSVTCADGNIGSATTININRASNSFTHTLIYSFNGLTGTIANKTTNTSIGWVIPTDFYARIPNAKSGIVTITCQTYSGNTLIGTSTTTANVFVVNSEPMVSAVIKDINSTSLALTENENTLIKYISDAQVNVTANAQNSATIVSIRVVNGSQTKTTAESVVEAVDSGTFTITCTDSRGFTSAPFIIEKDFVNYTNPAITDLQLKRPTTTSNTVQAVVEGQFYNGLLGNTNNSIDLKFAYREAGNPEAEWSDFISLTPVISGNNFSFQGSLGNIFNYQNSYDFCFFATDAILSTPAYFPVTQGIPLIDIGKNDVTVNKQIFMGENKVLSFQDGKLVDEEGTEYYLEQQDTGWIESTLSDAFISYNSTSIPKYRKVGRMVEVIGTIKPATTITGSGTEILIFTLPIGFRPLIGFNQICQGSGINKWLLSVIENGDVCFSRYGTTGYANTPTTAWLPFHVIFLAD